jgi:hypothetical protein
MNEKSLTVQSMNLQAGSIREQSASTIQAAIRLPNEPGETLKRVNTVLALGFDPDLDNDTRAGIRVEFIRALAEFPDWAVQRAFDEYVKTGKRRPWPAEIVDLARAEIRHLQDELRIRTRMQKPDHEDNEAARPSADQATAMLESAGFTPRRMQSVIRFPMAASFEEAEAAAQDTAQHWTAKAAPDSPALDQLRAAREASPLVAEARAAGLEGVE